MFLLCQKRTVAADVAGGRRRRNEKHQMMTEFSHISHLLRRGVGGGSFAAGHGDKS